MIMRQCGSNMIHILPPTMMKIGKPAKNGDGTAATVKTVLRRIPAGVARLLSE